MKLLSKKVLASIVTLALILVYLIKRRTTEFKMLLKKERSFYRTTAYTANELVRYSSFWLEIFKISSCFTRSLVIRDILLMGGFNPNIQIGISNDNEQFESHCWVKLDNFYTENKETRRRFKVMEIEK
tara:strand:+ start:6776 stop:7159 length:384 start_codon:yes stop_codon:yes gene_type:complete